MAFVWNIDVDWNNDGVYEADEATRLIRGRISRGTETWLGSPSAGVAELVLRNTDRRFDAWYSGSPLYGWDPAGKRIRIRLTIDGGATHTVFTGRIQTLAHSGFRAALAPGPRERQCTLVAHDGWQTLKDAFVDIPLATNTNVRTAISSLLDAVGWTVPGGSAWQLDVSQLDLTTILGSIVNAGSDLGSDLGDTLPYFWAMADRDVMTQILALVDSHWARCHITGDGTFVYRSLAEDNAAATTLTLTDELLQELEVSYNLDALYNDVRVLPHPRALASLAAIYTWQEVPLQIMPGETRTLLIEFASASGERVPGVNVVTPVAGTDYKAYQNSDGTGDTRTSDVSVTFTLYGTGASAVVTNTGGSSLWLTLFQVRGQAINDVTSQQLRAQNLVSIERRGRRVWERDAPWLQKTLIAQDLATVGAAYFGEPHPELTLRWQSEETAFAYELGTKLQDATTFGDGAKYRLGQVVHEIQENCSGQNVISTWRLNPLLTDDFWQLDSATLSILGVTTKLGV